ncbi:AraC family transcriptional regulator [Chitinophaga pollutisoli]|uniref:AraC family transcriptional regulator n=1 Tax=Chitinophaga pollutisoli TaxID=3133966 RepID=A0ABZ2YTI5_9BACT
MVRIASTATVALYNLEGTARLLTRGRGALELEANSYQILRLQPESHRLELAEGRHVFLLLFLSPTIQSLVSHDSIVAPYAQPPAGTLCKTRLNQILSLYQPLLKGDIWRLKRQVLLLDLLFHTLDDAGIQYRLEDMDVYHNDYQTLNRVKSYIAENIDKKLSIAHLAKHFGVQPTQLRRGYYRVFHQHLCDYIRDLRLDKARRLLTQTGLPVHEIAWEVGYESAAGFSRVFSHYYQQPPMDIRK